MRIDRKVVARKNQWLVALPSELRRHLGLVPGARVWWHIGRKGMAVLTVSGRARGGRPTRDEDCPTCAKYRAEVERLRRELRDGEQATAGQLVREGFEQAVATYGEVADRMDAQREMLRDLRAMVRELVKRGAPGAPPEAAPRISPRLAGVMVAAAMEQAREEAETRSTPMPAVSEASSGVEVERSPEG